MIAIDVRAEGNASITHFSEPIKFAIKGEVLKNGKNRDQKSEEHDEPHKGAPIVRGSERNIKITRPSDLTLAKVFLEEERSRQ